MAVYSRSLPHDLRIVPNDLPDDTEESLVGIVWHQSARDAAAAGLASIDERRGGGWGVYEEVGLSGLLHQDGRPYTPRPDVFVLAGTIAGTAAEVALADVGAPLLVLEIASEATWTNDVGDKRSAYEAAGVGEYLVFDPTGAYLPQQVRAWRLDTGSRFVEWTVTNGMWESTTLAVRFFVDGPLLRVQDRDGWTPALTRQAALRELMARQRAEEQATRARQEAARAEAAEQEVQALRERLEAMEEALRRASGLD